MKSSSRSDRDDRSSLRNRLENPVTLLSGARVRARVCAFACTRTPAIRERYST